MLWQLPCEYQKLFRKTSLLTAPAPPFFMDARFTAGDPKDMEQWAFMPPSWILAMSSSTTSANNSESTRFRSTLPDSDSVAVPELIYPAKNLDSCLPKNGSSASITTNGMPVKRFLFQ